MQAIMVAELSGIGSIYSEKSTGSLGRLFQSIGVMDWANGNSTCDDPIIVKTSGPFCVYRSNVGSWIYPSPLGSLMDQIKRDDVTCRQYMLFSS